MLLDSLSAKGFQIDLVSNEKEAFEALRQGEFDLVLLNLELPERSGIETCRHLRALRPDMRIVMIRVGGTHSDDFQALDAGADDCIAAPFRFREIVARLGAVLGRRGNEEPSEGPILRAGALEIDAEKKLFRRAGREVHLSPQEFDLLLFFMKNQETALTHIRLLRAVCGGDAGHDPRYLRSYVKTLRRKIENDPANPEYILTEPWVGYRFHNPAV